MADSEKQYSERAITITITNLGSVPRSKITWGDRDKGTVPLVTYSQNRKAGPNDERKDGY